MKTFIEDYLHNPSAAIAKASESMKGTWHDTINEEDIYSQISSPEFRLYESIILASSEPVSQRLTASV